MAYDSYYPNPDSEEDKEGMHEEDMGEEHEQMEGETALLPKTILAGKDFKVGDEVVLKIVRMMEDEIEVAYAPEKKESKKYMDEAMDGMGRMAGMTEE